MIRILLLLIIFTGHSLAASRMQLELPASDIRQGALVKAKLFVPPESLNLPLQKLKGETLAETIYIQQLSPLMKKEGSPDYVAEVQLVFIKIPDTNPVAVKLNDEVIEVGWNNVQIIPVETPEELLWADFTAPDFLEGNFIWLWIILLILILGGGGFYGWKKISFRNAVKLRKRQLMTEFKSCQNYEDVVSMWKRKRVYLKEFPHLETSFPPFEEVLFRYQFKPKQSETEKSEVVKAYRKLLDQSEGGFYGI